MATPQYERIVGGATTSVTLSGLEPGTTYRIRVWSTDGTSVSSGAGEINVATVESGELYIVHTSISVQLTVFVKIPDVHRQYSTIIPTNTQCSFHDFISYTL